MARNKMARKKLSEQLLTASLSAAEHRQQSEGAVNNNREAELSCRDHYLPRRVTLHAGLPESRLFRKLEEGAHEALNYDEAVEEKGWKKIEPDENWLGKFARARSNHCVLDKSEFSKRTSCFCVPNLNDQTARMWDYLSARAVSSGSEFLRRRRRIENDYGVETMSGMFQLRTKVTAREKVEWMLAKCDKRLEISLRVRHVFEVPGPPMLR
ncbi:hypothetical protein WN48_09586 [Eufriesea mexicana]|uniref:Uncharacterized protein n=1 Tax=Eufriesea mexicana TaxID=516756 RepID=A0A310SHL0_9HYME|nr:hypothetical protein WN48_09586 [Eufriesea mexicana]